MPDSEYTVRIPLPDAIVRDRVHVLRAPVYRSGELIVPDSAAVSISTGGELLSFGAAVIVDGVATYTLDATVLEDEDYAPGYLVAWSIVLDDGTILSPRNSASLVRNGLWPVITDADLIRRVPALDPHGPAPITSAQTYQNQLDDAWTELVLRLTAKGNRVNLILEPTALRMAHLYLTLALIFEGEETRLSAAWHDKGATFRALYKEAYDDLTPEYATGDGETADIVNRATTPTVWLTGGSGRGS